MTFGELGRQGGSLVWGHKVGEFYRRDSWAVRGGGRLRDRTRWEYAEGWVVLPFPSCSVWRPVMEEDGVSCPNCPSVCSNSKPGNILRAGHRTWDFACVPSFKLHNHPMREVLLAFPFSK